MTEESIRKYATLMKELELTGLEVNENGCTMRLERGNAPSPSPAVYKTQDSAEERQEEPSPASDDDVIVSPMVGVFYTSPAENADPYVIPGKTVRKGETVCIIEAMKLLNEITAENDCVILDVLQKNGAVIGFGTPLFRIRRT